MRGSNPLSRSKIKKMTDKEALQEIVYMTNDFVNNADYRSPTNFIHDLVTFIEENVIHCAMDNNYK